MNTFNTLYTQTDGTTVTFTVEEKTWEMIGRKTVHVVTANVNDDLNSIEQALINDFNVRYYTPRFTTFTGRSN